MTVVDVETTGLDPRVDRVVELAVVRLDHRGEILGAESQLVNPFCTIGAELSAIHGITDEMVLGAPGLLEAIALLRVSESATIVAHNAAFDLGFLSGPVGEPSLARLPRICTWRCASKLVPDSPSHRNAVLLHHLRLRMPSWFGARPPFHAALPDAVATSRILRHLLTLATADELRRISGEAQILTTVSFGKYKGRRWSEMDHGFLRWCLDPSRQFGEDVRRTAQHHLGSRR